MAKDNDGFRKALARGAIVALTTGVVIEATSQSTQDNELLSHYTFAGVTTGDTEGRIISYSGVGGKVEIPEGTLLGGIQTYTDKNQEYVIVEARIPTKTKEGHETTKIATVLISTENTKTVPINENNEIKPDRIGIVYGNQSVDIVTEKPGEPGAENEVLYIAEDFSDVLTCKDVMYRENEYVNVYTYDDNNIIFGSMLNDMVSQQFGTPENRYWDLSKFDEVTKSYMNGRQETER